MNRWVRAAIIAPAVGAASLFFAMPAWADEFDCDEGDTECIYQQGYADAEGDYGGDWAGDLGLTDPGYEWGGIASPYLNVCSGIDTTIPLIALGGCTGDLTAGQIMP